MFIFVYKFVLFWLKGKFSTWVLIAKYYILKSVSNIIWEKKNTKPVIKCYPWRVSMFSRSIIPSATSCCKNVKTLPQIAPGHRSVRYNTDFPPPSHLKLFPTSCVASNFDKGWRGDHKHKIMDRPCMSKYGTVSQVLLQLVVAPPWFTVLQVFYLDLYFHIKHWPALFIKFENCQLKPIILHM